MSRLPGRRRLMILVALPALGALLLMALLVTGQDQPLPEQASQLVDAYRATQSTPLDITRIVRGERPESLNRQIVRRLPVSVRAATRPSSGLYAGVVIQPPAAEEPAAAPQAVWCVMLRDELGQETLLVVGQYERVGQADWLLYQPLMPDVFQRLGCSGKDARS